MGICDMGLTKSCFKAVILYLKKIYAEKEKFALFFQSRDIYEKFNIKSQQFISNVRLRPYDNL